MTLTEARKILEQQLVWCRSSINEPEPPRPNSDDFCEAIETAISVLPEDISVRPSCRKRIFQLRERVVQAEDFDPFENRSRETERVLWRYAIFRKLRSEGYSLSEIGKVSDYDHSTVLAACNHVKNWLEAGDPVMFRVWREFLESIGDYGEGQS